MSVPLLKVSVLAGKYTVIQDADGALHALRYGEKWRDCTGDGLILSLAYEVERLRTKLDAAMSTGRYAGVADREDERRKGVQS